MSLSDSLNNSFFFLDNSNFLLSSSDNILTGSGLFNSNSNFKINSLKDFSNNNMNHYLDGEVEVEPFSDNGLQNESDFQYIPFGRKSEILPLNDFKLSNNVDNNIKSLSNSFNNIKTSLKIMSSKDFEKIPIPQQQQQQIKPKKIIIDKNSFKTDTNIKIEENVTKKTKRPRIREKRDVEIKEDIRGNTYRILYRDSLKDHGIELNDVIHAIEVKLDIENGIIPSLDEKMIDCDRIRHKVYLYECIKIYTKKSRPFCFVHINKTCPNCVEKNKRRKMNI